MKNNKQKARFIRNFHGLERKENYRIIDKFPVGSDLYSKIIVLLNKNISEESIRFSSSRKAHDDII